MAVPEATPVVTNHLEMLDDGTVRVAGTRWKVRLLAEWVLRDGYAAEQIVADYPDGPSLAAIHAALAYYYDHQAEYDAEIAELDRLVEELKARQANDSVVQRLLRERDERLARGDTPS